MSYIRVKGYGNVALKCNSQPISRVLYPLMGCLSFIYAWCHHNAKAFYPPARASDPQAPVYMNLQPPRHTARTSLHGRWALTPPSHPYPRRGGYFLLRYSAFTSSFLLGSGVLCAARTFLLCLWGNGDRPADCVSVCKNTKNSVISVV